MNRFATIDGDTYHFTENRQKNRRALSQLRTTVLVRTLPQIATALYSWLGGAEGALRVALSNRRYPPRDAGHGYTNSSQNDQENDTDEAGNHRPSGNNL